MTGTTRALVPLLAVLLPGCQEYGYTSNVVVDAFQQDRVNAVDLLIVVDNSCSMVEEQDNLAVNFDGLLARFREAEVDWRIGVTTTDVEVERYRGLLVGGDDEVILDGPNGEIDRVAWDRSWPMAAGVALALDGRALDPASNDSASSWCPAVDDFGFGLGTPGERNLPCGGGPPSATPDDPDEGPRAPTAGELVFSEIMSMSGGDDGLCEWVELTSTVPHTLSLGGLELVDEGRNHAVLPEVEVPPWGVVVIGRSTECGPVDIVLDDGFTLADDVRVLGPDTPRVDELFGEHVAQGTLGTGIEMGLEAARLVLDEPYYTEDNGAWLRPEASLSILFVSDEDDASPLAVHDYVRFFTDLKGDAAYRDRRLVNLSAVVATEPPPRDDLPSCSSDNGLAWYGGRYLAAASDTEGLVESICATDFAPIVSELGLTVSGLEVAFALSEVPKLSTLEVALYRTDDASSLVRELVIDEDYTYEADGNLIRFVADQLPPAEHWVVAEYEALPGSAAATATTRGAASSGGAESSKGAAASRGGAP